MEKLKFSIRIDCFSVRSLCKPLYATATLQLRRTIFGPLERHFGGSWGALGGSWGGLGGSWGALGGVLGGSWAVLWRSWVDILSSQIFDRFFDRFWSPKGCPKGGIPGAKIDQNRSQNESKFKTIFKSEKVGLQEPLGAVLGRSWGILEAILGSNMALRYTRACVW